jgi:hypothetical protein
VTDAGNAPIGNGSVSLLDIASGRVLSKIPVAGQPDGAVVDARRGRAFVTAAALPVLDIAHGRVSRTIPLSISTQGLGLDETTGRLFAITSPGNTPVNGPPNDTLTMLDGQDGRALSAVAIGNNQSQVIVDENAGRVVVIGNGSNGGLEVDVADARTGRLLRKTTTTAVTLGSSLNAGLQSPSPVVDARRGRVYLALTDPSDPTKAYAGVCDTRTGALLRTTAVRGSYIQAMAIDARSGRLFVVSVAQGPSPQGYLTIIDL